MSTSPISATGQIGEGPSKLTNALKLISVSTIGGLLASLLNFFILGHLVRTQEEQRERTRASLQGFWLFETKTKDTTFNPYKDMKIIEQASLTVDSSFNVHGI